MTAYFIRRLLGIAPLLIGITFIPFFVIHLAPGNVVDAQGAFNTKMSPEARQKLTQIYGLDKPVWVQYKEWLTRLIKMDLGNSFADGASVKKKIARAIPVTLAINGLSLFFILLIGIPLGVWCAARSGSFFDRAAGFFVFAGFSVPTFWLALLLMALLGVQWRWLPVSGLTSIFFDEMSFWEKVLDIAKHLVLPVLVSSITGIAVISRFIRSSVIHELSQNYVRTARAKGLSESVVLRRHVLRNALLPVITILGLSVPGLLGGSVLFESIFSLPGMGRLFYASIFTRDYPVIMGILVLGAVMTLLGNLLADMAYAASDPRIKLR